MNGKRHIMGESEIGVQSMITVCMYGKYATDREADKVKKYRNVKYNSIYQNLIFMTAVAAVTLIMYYFCRVNDSDALKWILTPTAWWVSILGGIPFEYLRHQGYVNHLWQFVIAPSCAGCRFMLITFLMMVFLPGRSDSVKDCKEDAEDHDAAIKSAVARNAGNHDGRENDAETKRHNIGEKWIWFGCSMIVAYVSTISVNGIRIVAAIYLPALLERKQLMGGWLTPNRLHTLIGTVTYFISLCVMYPAALSVHDRIAGGFKGRRMMAWQESTQDGARTAAGTVVRTVRSGRLLVPAFWYLLFVLALPFVKRVFHHDLAGFGSYAAVIAGVCGSVCVVMAVEEWIRSSNSCPSNEIKIDNMEITFTEKTYIAETIRDEIK